MSTLKITLGFLVLAGLLAVGSASAETLAVNCGAGESLQAAIDGLNPLARNMIVVQGTCAEQIGIAGHQSLRINGPATIQPTTGTAMTVDRGTNLEICGLTMDGGATGIFVRGSRVQTGNYCGGLPVIVRNASYDGISLAEKSLFRSSFTLIVEDNDLVGITVHDSRLELISSGAAGADVSSIQDNGHGAPGLPGAGRAGIYATEGSSVELQRVDVLNNQGSGVNVDMGGLLHLVAGNVTGNTGPGVVLSNNSTGQLTTFVGASYPTGAISGNSDGGVVVTQRSALRLRNAPVISGNTGGNLVCTVGGDAYGDASNVPHLKKDCKSFEAVPND